MLLKAYYCYEYWHKLKIRFIVQKTGLKIRAKKGEVGAEKDIWTQGKEV